MKRVTNVTEFIKEHTITEREAIMKAKNMPKSIPDSFCKNPIIPVAYGVFLGDDLPAGWSVNDKFIKGKLYPVYWEFEIKQDYVVGEDGEGYKLVPKAWSRIIDLK